MTQSQATTDFAGQVAWITGGARGFGAGLARRLAAAGVTVVVSDVDVEAGQAVAEEVGGSFLACDVSSYDENRATVDAIVAAHGRLDIAFLNAGIATGTNLGEGFDLALYRRAMGVNLDGVVFGTQACFEAMTRTGGGRIVATASLAGLTGTPFDVVYSANKHGVVGLVRSIGEDWTRHGITVNAICPGFADTAIVIPELRELLSGSGVPLLAVDVVIDAVIDALTSGRSGECWFIQPGRPAEPFRFRGIPGPR